MKSQELLPVIRSYTERRPEVVAAAALSLAAAIGVADYGRESADQDYNVYEVISSYEQQKRTVHCTKETRPVAVGTSALSSLVDTHVTITLNTDNGSIGRKTHDYVEGAVAQANDLPSRQVNGDRTLQLPLACEVQIDQ